MFLSFSFIFLWMYSCKSHFGKLPPCKYIQGHLFLMRSHITQIYSCFLCCCCCCCFKSQQQTLMQLIIQRTLWASRTKHKIKQKRSISAGSYKCWFPEMSIISLQPWVKMWTVNEMLSNHNHICFKSHFRSPRTCIFNNPPSLCGSKT